MRNVTERGLDVDRRQWGCIDRRLEADPPATGEIEVLRRSWRSLGVRRLALTWELAGPARLRPGLAGELRSALGPALRQMGAHRAFAAVHGPGGVPGFWFLGWDSPAGAVREIRAQAICLGAMAESWPELRAALSRLCLTRAGGGVVKARQLHLRWLPGGEEGPGFGPPLPAPELGLSGGACLVEAVSPLCVRSQGRVHREPPPMAVLVRSAGERLRQLCARWGEEGELRRVVARAVQEASQARLSWDRLGVERAHRRSSRSGQVQELVGLRGVMAYEEVPPLAMALLSLGMELGVGKDTAFGCGSIRVYRAVSHPMVSLSGRR
jgi:hypothetical protein